MALKLTTDDISYSLASTVSPRATDHLDRCWAVEVFKGPNAFISIYPDRLRDYSSVGLASCWDTDGVFTTDISSDMRIGEHLNLGQRAGEAIVPGVRLNLSQHRRRNHVETKHRGKLLT